VDYETVLKEQARGVDLSKIKEFLTDLGLLREAISENVNPRLALEWLMLNLPRLESPRRQTRNPRQLEN